MDFRGYYAVDRLTLGANNWVAVVGAFDGFQTIGADCNEQLVKRGNLDTFVHVADDPETEENEEVIVSNACIWEGHIAGGQITIANIKSILAELFDKEVEDIGHSITKMTIRERPTAIATFTYGGIDRIRLAFFGCDDEDDLCTWEQSRKEVEGYLIDNIEDWNGVE